MIKILFYCFLILFFSSCASSDVPQTTKLYENVSKFAILDAAKRLFQTSNNSNELLLDSYENEVNATYVIPHAEFLNMDIIKKSVSFKVKELNASEYNNTFQVDVNSTLNSNYKSIVLDTNDTNQTTKLMVTLSMDYKDVVNDTDVKYYSQNSHEDIWEQLNYFLGITNKKQHCLVLDPNYEIVSKIECFSLVLNNIDKNTTKLDMNKYVKKQNAIILDVNSSNKSFNSDLNLSDGLSKDIIIVDIDLRNIMPEAENKIDK